MVGDHLINLKPGSMGLGPLMGQGLVQRANPAIENRLHKCSSLSPEVLTAFGIVHSVKLTLEDWVAIRVLLGLTAFIYLCQYMVM